MIKLLVHVTMAAFLITVAVLIVVLTIFVNSIIHSQFGPTYKDRTEFVDTVDSNGSFSIYPGSSPVSATVGGLKPFALRSDKGEIVTASSPINIDPRALPILNWDIKEQDDQNDDIKVAPTVHVATIEVDKETTLFVLGETTQVSLNSESSFDYYNACCKTENIATDVVSIIIYLIVILIVGMIVNEYMWNPGLEWAETYGQKMKRKSKDYDEYFYPDA